MNLDQITTKCWILALFIRDDGERLLLGDGWFDFKDSLQHFQPNSIANDIVELQGTDGQLLAGQVRRSASQSFDGYIGDALTSKTEIENRRRQFIQFFRVRRHYKVIYIFPDGTAIQRRMGYLTDAPSVPEMWQKFPEYHVALNFEDVNYYEYAEDAQGDEIYAHESLVKLISVQSGGLVWDEYGAVSHGYTWLDPQTVTGDYITVTDGATGSPLTLSQLTGNATQDGTPTPDAPVPISTVTGENTVKITGKNLFDGVMEDGGFDINGINGSNFARVRCKNYVKVSPSTTYTIKVHGWNTSKGAVCGVSVSYYDTNDYTTPRLSYNNWENGGNGYTFTTPSGCSYIRFLFSIGSALPGASIIVYTDVSDIQLELGNQASQFEPYQGQEFEVNLGKNLATSGSAVGGSTLQINLAQQQFKAGTYTISFVGLANVSGGTIVIRNGGTNIVSNAGSMDTTANERSSASFTISQSTATALSASTSPNICIYKSGAGYTVGDTVEQPQVELGQATSYAPYFTPIELAKIGTYQDRIYKTGGKWYIEKQVGKVEVAISYMVDAHGLKGGVFVPANKKSGVLGALCDKATLVEPPTSTTVFDGAFYENPANFIFLGSAGDDLASLRTKFNGATLYYALATPTTTEITDETLLSQLNFIASLYEGVNNISIVGTGAQGEMTLNYYADVDTTGAGYEWEAGEGGGPTTVQVIGVDNAQPIWTVTGPATNPTLTNITTIQTITWNGTVPNGQKLIVDMANQTATLAGANVYEFITGSWLTLRPGANKLTYSAQGADQASQIQWNGVVG